MSYFIRFFGDIESRSALVLCGTVEQTQTDIYTAEMIQQYKEHSSFTGSCTLLSLGILTFDSLFSLGLSCYLIDASIFSTIQVKYMRPHRCSDEEQPAIRSKCKLKRDASRVAHRPHRNPKPFKKYGKNRCRCTKNPWGRGSLLHNAG